jgi:hypothetical protein
MNYLVCIIIVSCFFKSFSLIDILQLRDYFKQINDSFERNLIDNAFDMVVRKLSVDFMKYKQQQKEVVYFSKDYVRVLFDSLVETITRFIDRFFLFLPVYFLPLFNFLLLS